MNFDSYDYLYREYIVNERSTSAIAKEWNRPNSKVYPNTIRRTLQKHGIKIRSKAEAQKNYLDTNPHPMEGRERTPEERRKISQGIQNFWDDLDPDDVERFKREMSERASQKWERMSDKEKKEAIKKMHIASHNKANQGSKNENKVAELLKEAGFKIIQRTNEYSPRRQFEIDMAIPSYSVAVEWDGAAHFEPIYGEENLRKVMEKDKRKNEALTRYGWTVIRCRDHSTAHSLAFCRRAVSKIIERINSNKKKKVIYIDAE